MSSNMKPIRIYGKGGPNPTKVLFLLEELQIPYEVQDVQFADVKKAEYVAVNPNGRLPAIYDPNTDLTLWESGAIIQYLVDRYDQEHKLSFPSGSNEAWSASQWLFFQVSGQGPYFGQVIYFRRFHHENVPSTVERFIKEVHRVTGVLEGHLKKQKAAGGSDGPWLVGGKLSYADIAFIPWQSGAAKFLEGSGEFDSKEYPLVTEWVEKMTSRKAIKTVLEMADH